MKTLMVPSFSRRRLFQLFAGAAGVGAVSALAGGTAVAKGMQSASWRGVALGAEASMTLLHPDNNEAKRALEEAVDELKRLEAIFSIYDPTSAVSRLNRDGFLVQPPMELVSLMSAARRINEATNGHFDISVQPLWELPEDQNSQSVKLVDQLRIEFDSKNIKLASGQAVTFNGIAQGAIADAMCALLRRRGYDDFLLDTGEIVASGLSPDLNAWQVQLVDERGPIIPLRDKAVATSQRSQPKAHLFNPHTGRRGGLYSSVSVVADQAILADGLSTALSVMPEGEWPAALQKIGGTGIHVYGTRLDGSALAYPAKKPV